MAHRMYRITLLLLAGLGTLAGAQLSLSHLETGQTCPLIGALPACFVVLAGYCSVLLATVWYRMTFAWQLFLLGWVPVFVLASVGVVTEIVNGGICPEGPFGVPQCFFSLAMIAACIALFWKVRSILGYNGLQK